MVIDGKKMYRAWDKRGRERGNLHFFLHFSYRYGQLTKAHILYTSVEVQLSMKERYERYAVLSIYQKSELTFSRGFMQISNAAQAWIFPTQVKVTIVELHTSRKEVYSTDVDDNTFDFIFESLLYAYLLSIFCSSSERCIGILRQ